MMAFARCWILIGLALGGCASLVQPAGPSNAMMTKAEMNALMIQIVAHWQVPAVALDDTDRIVPIHVQLAQDGAVVLAEVVEVERYNGDVFYHRLADSARRAVLLASPLKVPPEKYNQWKDFEIRFNPKDMVGQ